jgi:hypothetical protein
MPETTRRMGCDCTVARVSFARRPPAGTPAAPVSGQGEPQQVMRAVVPFLSGVGEKAGPAVIPRRRPVDGSCRKITARLRKDVGDVHLLGEQIFVWSQVTLC